MVLPWLSWRKNGSNILCSILTSMGKKITDGGELEKTLFGFVESQEAVYGKDPFHDTLGDRFCYVLKAAHEKTGQRAVVLVDEYDKRFYQKRRT